MLDQPKHDNNARPWCPRIDWTPRKASSAVPHPVDVSQATVQRIIRRNRRLDTCSTGSQTNSFGPRASCTSRFSEIFSFPIFSNRELTLEYENGSVQLGRGVSYRIDLPWPLSLSLFINGKTPTGVTVATPSPVKKQTLR